MTTTIRFQFGKNWRAYVRHRLDRHRVNQSVEALKRLIGRTSLKNQSFLDIGCGSGLQTVSAALLGAKSIHAIDVDPESVATTRETIKRFAPSEADIEVKQASVLEAEDVMRLPESDIVYTWGVLHHTGRMWQATVQASSRVKAGGLLVMAIYNNHWSSPYWHKIKWVYNHLPPLGKRLMFKIFWLVIFGTKFLVTGTNPLVKSRGMDFSYDVWDWIGGFPYQYASPGEVTDFVQALGFFTVTVIPASTPTGCNQYVFRKNETDSIRRA